MVFRFGGCSSNIKLIDDLLTLSYLLCCYECGTGDEPLPSAPALRERAQREALLKGRPVTVLVMAQSRQWQHLRDLSSDPNIARFVVEGIATGKQLGTGSYGAVEEV